MSNATVCANRLIDWIAFTVKDCTTPETIFNRLGLQFIALPYGRHGYKQAAIAASGGITVYWDGHMEDMGVHVQVSGQGCRLIEAMPEFPNWRQWLCDWFDEGMKVTRLDLALDDEGRTVDFQTVYDAVATKTAVCRADGYELRKTKSKKGIAQTLYVGRRASGTMMRCYDKGFQLGQESFLRFEFEFKRERADAVARILAYNGWDDAVGVVRSFIEFKDETHKTTDRTRQRAADWWVQLVNASKHMLCITREVHANIIKSYQWFERQVSSVLAVLIECEGGDISWLVEMAKRGKSKWKERHRIMLTHGQNLTFAGALP